MANTTAHRRLLGARMAVIGFVAMFGLIAILAIHQHDAAAGSEGDESEPRMQADAVESMMDHTSMAGNPHMRYTEPRTPTPDDLARADHLIEELRPALEKYRDYRVALQDGYRQFLPNVQQPIYHFTNRREGFLGIFSFNPTKPTTLLYKKTTEGFDLVGAMYTAPRQATDEELDRRVPLSVATWHAHVNICAAPKAQRATADRTRFGIKGSIATKAACNEAGGTFYPQLFGWMVHVHPFEQTREKIWAH